MLTRVIVCGGRNANIDANTVDSCISEILEDYVDTDVEFVSGAATGGDKLGEEYAHTYGYTLTQFKPDWKTYGRAAGPIRNHKMIDYIEDADYPVVIAFWDGSSKGTRDTIKTAQSRHIPVHIIRYTNELQSIESGIQLDGDNINYDFNEDEPEDILPLVAQKTVKSRKHGHVFYYSFKANKGHPDWSVFLDKFKHSSDIVSLEKLADQICNSLFATFNRFDCMLYLKSASKLNEIIVDAIHDIDPYMPAYAISKTSTSKITFDWDRFNKNFHGDDAKYDYTVKRINSMMSRIHKSDRFSMQKLVYPPFRKYVNNFLDIEDLDEALDDIIASDTILLLDDIITTGSTMLEMIKMLDDIGYEGDIVIYSLIYNK